MGNGGECRQIHFICTNKWFKARSRCKKYSVFTVSSKEFLKKKRLDPDDTEFLQELNECHSETFNYVSGARGILSLMQGARSREGLT
ncbi:hypothetical protein F7725_003441 [Dissostichus mawsoni]|uniref:Uncharacterized protein n=1 Tax=Dissostichus mawsoni TaxID=36200 RepID=A0A7J5YB83_DISMA|nr:hypothetical protein F7725_003441 [Dissostichus mawsoni]